MSKDTIYATVFPIMTAVATKKTSPVNVEDRKNLDMSAGDTVRVWVKVQEKGKTRLQPFEGMVLARKHGNEPGATFTVRRVSGGYGIEKIFPLYSPIIDKIEVLRHVKMRRAKLYHLRDKAAREIKRQMRKMKLVSVATESDTEIKAQAEKEAADAEEKAKQAEEAAQQAESAAVEEVKDETPVPQETETQVEETKSEPETGSNSEEKAE